MLNIPPDGAAGDDVPNMLVPCCVGVPNEDDDDPPKFMFGADVDALKLNPSENINLYVKQI